MKNLIIFILTLSLGLFARADLVDDKLKAFTEALKASKSIKPDANPMNPMMADRTPAMLAQLDLNSGPGGGEANMRAMITQIMAANADPAVQEAGKALLAELDERKKARLDALTAKVDEVLGSIPDILTKAQKTQELDDILSDLQKIQPTQAGMYGFDQETQAQMARVNAAYQFVAQWQDYLSARNNGNTQDAQNSLRNLINSRAPGEALLVPRSEILARTVELGNQPKPVPPAPPSPVDVGSILDGIKTLDDMGPALKAIRALPNISLSYDPGPLAQLLSTYSNAKNGLPFGFDQLPYNTNNAPELGRVKAMLTLYLLPGILGSSALPPNSNESVSDYLQRSIDAAEAKKDWTLLQRILEAKMKIADVVVPLGTHDFLIGLSQETAGQYSLAVTAYQGALSNPDDYLPTKLVGDRLAAIKKDHPEDFNNGMK